MKIADIWIVKVSNPLVRRHLVKLLKDLSAGSAEYKFGARRPSIRGHGRRRSGHLRPRISGRYMYCSQYIYNKISETLLFSRSSDY